LLCSGTAAWLNPDVGNLCCRLPPYAYKTVSFPCNHTLVKKYTRHLTLLPDLAIELGIEIAFSVRQNFFLQTDEWVMPKKGIMTGYNGWCGQAGRGTYSEQNYTFIGRNSMRSRLYANTKAKIISARISDDEMENVRQLMEVTHMSASEIMRSAFQVQIERLNGTGIFADSSL
jgi:hypothetical protein